MEFKSLKLSGNRFEIAPKFTIELNPKEAGKRSHVYFVWPFSPEAYPDPPRSTPSSRRRSPARSSHTTATIPISPSFRTAASP